MSKNIDRRHFLKKSLRAGIALAGATLLPRCTQIGIRGTVPPPYSLKPLEEVRIGFIGLGGMGTAHIQNLLNIQGNRIVAVCDLIPEKVKKIQNLHKEKGLPIPDGFSRGHQDYRNLNNREDIDLVFIATPWKCHVPMAVDAMLKSKHVAVEVPAAITIDGCWQLVETSEKMQKHCTMLENCNYDRIEMMILNMVNLGIFGELIHAQCGYLHDLRSIKFSDQGEGLWRREHSKTRDGDLYPTHGLGPVAQCLNINRGNYFKYIVSMSSKSRGLQLFAEEHFGPESQEAREKFKLGDVVVTLLKTYNGETAVLTHDTNLPRPYSRDIFIQGTKGIIRKYPEPRIYLQDSSPAHQWESINSYLQKYDHPLWKKMQTDLAEAAGHGGMDYLEDYRLIQAYRQGVVPDMNVYDAAMLSAVSELSETSVAKRGMPQRFPDFTRGMWQNSRKLPVMKI